MAFIEGEIGLQGQRYADDFDFICLFVLSMNGFWPRKRVCPMMFLLQDNNLRAVSGLHYLLSVGCSCTATKPVGPRFFGLAPRKRPEHTF